MSVSERLALIRSWTSAIYIRIFNWAKLLLILTRLSYSWFKLTPSMIEFLPFVGKGLGSMEVI